MGELTGGVISSHPLSKHTSWEFDSLLIALQVLLPVFQVAFSWSAPGPVIVLFDSCFEVDTNKFQLHLMECYGGYILWQT